MATDKKISELDPIVGNLDLSDVGVTVRSDNDFKFTFAQLLTLLQGAVTTGAVITFSNDTPPNTSGKNGDVVIKPGTGQLYQRVSGVWQLQYTISPGTLGNQIIYGAGAPNNATGNDNDSYIDTSAGVFYKKISGVWTIEFTMASGPAGATGPAGANGTNGADGKNILNGTTNPSNDLGTEGDFYLNTTTYVLFGPKTGGVWGSGFSLIPDPSLSPSITFELPAGSPIPMSFSDIGIFSTGFRHVLQLLLRPNGVTNAERVIYDIIVDAICTDSSLSEIDHFDVYGHEDPDNEGFTIDDVRITLIR